MGKFMQWMRQELEGIKVAEVELADLEVAEGEEVLGTLTDPDLRKLLVLHDRLGGQVVASFKQLAHKEIEMLDAESRPDHDEATCELCTMVLTHATLSDKMATVDALFCTGLRHELSEEAFLRLYKAGGTISIRKGWKIVACREPGSFSASRSRFRSNL